MSNGDCKRELRRRVASTKLKEGQTISFLVLVESQRKAKLRKPFAIGNLDVNFIKISFDRNDVVLFQILSNLLKK